MRHKILNKMLPVILAFALVVPNVSIQNPVIAADNDGVSYEQETEGLVEGVYSLPLNAYGVSSNGSVSENITQTRPAWNERAMVTVATGGAISLTLQIYSVIPYDAFQVMKPEVSSTYNVTTTTGSGNQALAAVPMGTFNLPTGYLDELSHFTVAITAAGAFNATADANYYGGDKVSWRADLETGFTYLTLQLDSQEQLDEKLVIKAAFALDKSAYLPVTTTFFEFHRESMVYVPDLEEFDDTSSRSVEVSNLRAGNVGINTATPALSAIAIPAKKANIQTLFTDAEIKVTEAVSGSSITVTGSLNPASVDDYANTGIHYGVLLVREYQGRTYFPDKADPNMYMYNRPYQNYMAEPLFKSIDITENTYQLEYDYTTENLVFGVPLNIVCDYDTAKMTRANLSTFSELTLGQLTGTNFIMFHVLPVPVEPVVLYDSSGYDINQEVYVTSDTGVLHGNTVLTVGSAEGRERNEALTPAAKLVNGELYLKGYTYAITTGGTAASLQKNVEIAVKLPGGWTESELYAWHVAPKAEGGNYNALYAPNSAIQSKVTVRDGYAIFNTSYSTGEIYLYQVDEPQDLNTLEDGIYQVRVAAMHASSEGTLSMSNSAMEQEAILKLSTGIDGSRVKELYLNFQALYITNEPSYLSKAGTASNYDYDDEDKSGISWGDNLDYLTTGEGSQDLLVNAWYKENYEYNIYLPKSVKLTLQEYTGAGSESAIYKNYYPVYFEIPPMDSDPTDGITVRAVRLMINSSVKLEDSIVLPTYQKTALQKAILEGEAIDGEVYTTDSFNALLAEISAAKESYNSNPDAEAIKSIVAAIQSAIAALTVDESKMADKSTLEAVLSEAKAITGENYTVSSYSELQTTITAAERIYNKDAATQAEVAAQVDALKAAIAALVFIDLGTVIPSELPEGTYTIPIRLWHAIKDSASMGDAALESTGILTIQKDESGEKKASLQFEMKPLIFAGLTGYLMEFNRLSDYTIGTSGYPENYTKNPATVLETHDYVDRYNAEDSEDERVRGQKYPKTLQIDVTLPETTGVDYTWVHVYVPVMGELDNGDQEARLRLDYTAIAKVGEPTLSLDYGELAMTVGGTRTLTASLTDISESVVWNSSDSSVASVDGNGKVTALAAGSTTITAAAGGLTASCLVTVTAAGSGGSTGGNTGGSESGLRNGTYNIPVSLWHALKDQASMGNAALVQSAKLVVNNGTGTVYVTFQPMTYLGQTGYLSELMPSTVVTTYDVTDQFNGETSTDARVKGTKYPRTLAIPVIPGEEFTTVSVYVPVMGSLGVGEQDARLRLYYSSAVLISDSTSLDISTVESGVNNTIGLARTGGKTYVYENGLIVTNRLVMYMGRNYYAGEDGSVATSRFITVEGRTYYAGEDGSLAAYKLITVDNKLYYAGIGGVITTSAMLTYEDKRYYAGSTGEIAAAEMVTYKNASYYAGEDGVIRTSALVSYEGKKYYATETGKLAVSALVTDKGSKYYAGEDGVIATGVMVTYAGEKYYAAKTGKLAVSALVTYKGARYYAGKDGAIVTSVLVTTSQGLKYYATKTGAIATSTMVTYKGAKYYATKTGRIAGAALVTYKGAKYYAANSGKITTAAFVTYKNNKYYASKAGTLVTSRWVTIKGVKYYFNQSGKLTKTVKQ